MLVIVEGPDGAGKTTLVNKLRSELKGYVWILRSNSSPPDERSLYETGNWIDSHPPDQICIVDRHPYISEYVYGPILRGRCLHQFIPPTIGTLLRGSLLIYCRPMMSTLMRGIGSETQRAGVVPALDLIVASYDQLLKQLDRYIHAIEYNWEDPRSVIVQRVQDFIDKRGD